ncbi:MAG: hypothetical protein IJ866_04030 [Alphaproteobacteria bacterium]|nr:hypothetical protein [Alphaproteobacteria bacterium]
MKKLITLTSIFALCSVPAIADEEGATKSATAFPHGLEIGLGLSATTGVNGFVGYVNKDFNSFWWKRIGVRADFATTKPLKSTINSFVDSAMGDDGIEVGDYMTITNGGIESNHFAALVDFYPFGDTWFLGGLRVSTGYVFGDAKVSALITSKADTGAIAGSEFELNGTEYKYEGGDIKAKAKADWKLSGPYLGAGFDLGIYRGFKLFMDAGVVFTTKSAELSLDVPETGLKYKNGGSWTDVDITKLANDINATVQDAQSDLDDYKFFPMIKVGFMYRF